MKTTPDDQAPGDVSKRHLKGLSVRLFTSPACLWWSCSSGHSGSLRCVVFVRACVRAAWETVVSRSERDIDSCHLLHELAELPAAWVAVTHVLGRCDHGADALPVCVLCRAVDLPALLRAGVQSLHNQTESDFC